MDDPLHAFDPDHPSCARCVRFASGPNRGRVFFRCLPCAVLAGRIRTAQIEEHRTGGPS